MLSSWNEIYPKAKVLLSVMRTIFDKLALSISHWGLTGASTATRHDPNSVQIQDSPETQLSFLLSYPVSLWATG